MTLLITQIQLSDQPKLIDKRLFSILLRSKNSLKSFKEGDCLDKNISNNLSLLLPKINNFQVNQ